MENNIGERIEVKFVPDWGHRRHPLGLLPELSVELNRDIRAWIIVWQEDLDPVFEVRWPSLEQGRAWVIEGHRLVRALRAELGDDYIVKPWFWMYDPDLID